METYWDTLITKYPAEMDHFFRWLEGYKRRINWKELFFSPHTPGNRNINFIDLPMAMQIGIFLEYTFEVRHDLTEIESMKELKDRIEEWFYNEHIWIEGK